MKAEINNSAMIGGPCYASRNLLTVAGLPVRAALFYLLLFAVALGFYSAIWPSAPIAYSDSPGYLGFAQDLSDLHIDQLQFRTPGYPLLLVLTGASRSPRTLFFCIVITAFFVDLAACQRSLPRRPERN